MQAFWRTNPGIQIHIQVLETIGILCIKKCNFFILLLPKRAFKLKEKPPAPTKRTSNTSKYEIS
jgi:hypothetical protein